MSEQTRQAVIEAIRRHRAHIVSEWQEGPLAGCWVCDEIIHAMNIDVADERRRAVAALGCQYVALDLHDFPCYQAEPEQDWPENCWCAPCRAQAELEADPAGGGQQEKT